MQLNPLWRESSPSCIQTEAAVLTRNCLVADPIMTSGALSLSLSCGSKKLRQVEKMLGISNRAYKVARCLPSSSAPVCCVPHTEAQRLIALGRLLLLATAVFRVWLDSVSVRRMVPRRFALLFDSDRQIKPKSSTSAASFFSANRVSGFSQVRVRLTLEPLRFSSCSCHKREWPFADFLWQTNFFFVSAHRERERERAPVLYCQSSRLRVKPVFRI